MPNQVAQELVFTIPLPDDKGWCGDGRPKVRRFRSHWLELGHRLREFRARYGVTQAEIAAVVDASNASTVAQWENGVSVPEGIRRERLLKLLDGRLWPALRAAVIASDGLPESWQRGVRWYRRASRERQSREMVGVVVATVLQHLRIVVDSPEGLRREYCEHDDTWVSGVANRCGLDEGQQTGLRGVEGAAYGLRWLEIAHGVRLDLRRSLVGQLLPGLRGGDTVSG